MSLTGLLAYWYRTCDEKRIEAEVEWRKSEQWTHMNQCMSPSVQSSEAMRCTKTRAPCVSITHVYRMIPLRRRFAVTKRERDREKCNGQLIPCVLSCDRCTQRNDSRRSHLMRVPTPQRNVSTDTLRCVSLPFVQSFMRNERLSAFADSKHGTEGPSLSHRPDHRSHGSNEVHFLTLPLPFLSLIGRHEKVCRRFFFFFFSAFLLFSLWKGNKRLSCSLNLTDTSIELVARNVKEIAIRKKAIESEGEKKINNICCI